MPLGTTLSLSASLKHASRQGAPGVCAEPAAALLSCAVWWEDEVNPLAVASKIDECKQLHFGWLLFSWRGWW